MSYLARMGLDGREAEPVTRPDLPTNARDLVRAAQVDLGFTDDLHPGSNIAAMARAAISAVAENVDPPPPPADVVEDAVRMLTALGWDHIEDLPSGAMVDPIEDAYAQWNDMRRKEC